MNVIEGQANLKKKFSLIFYSLTFNNILNIIVMVILAGIVIVSAVSDGGIIDRTQSTLKQHEAQEIKEIALSSFEYLDIDSLTESDAILDMQETALAIYQNLFANGYELLNSIEKAGITTLPIDEFNKIKFEVKGDYGTHIGEVTAEGDVNVKDKTEDIPSEPSTEELELAYEVIDDVKVALKIVGGINQEETFISILETMNNATIPGSSNSEKINNGIIGLATSYGYSSDSGLTQIEFIYDEMLRIEVEDKSVEDLISRLLVFVSQIYLNENDTPYDIMNEGYLINLGNGQNNNTIEVSLNGISGKKNIYINSRIGQYVQYDNKLWRVLYDDEERGVQLISNEVLDIDGVKFGIESLGVDWTNTDVIAEANIDETDGLTDIEQMIYCYNNTIKILNDKCKKLVTFDKYKFKQIRSVGSNPIDSDNQSGMYIDQEKVNLAIWHNGVYDKKIRINDENDCWEDYEQMEKIDWSNSTTGDRSFWLAHKELIIENNCVQGWSPKHAKLDLSGNGSFSIFNIYQSETTITTPGTEDFWTNGLLPIIVLQDGILEECEGKGTYNEPYIITK